jgi:hypothetical protein
MQFLLIFLRGVIRTLDGKTPGTEPRVYGKVPGLPGAGRWKRNRQGQTRREV